MGIFAATIKFCELMKEEEAADYWVRKCEKLTFAIADSLK
jgi:hypothetical protein